MKDEKIIEEVCNKLVLADKNYKYFTDGTDCKVMLLNDKYLIKVNEPRSLKADNEYLLINNHPLLQKLVYSHEDYSYSVYNFIPGEVMRNLAGYNIKKVVNQVREFIDTYPDYKSDVYGYLDAPVSSFKQFLLEEVNYNKDLINFDLDYDLIYKIISKLSESGFETKLLHGDLGTHNILGDGKELVGIIDPQPVIGDPLYEILAFITSNKEIINLITVEEIIEMNLSNPSRVIEMLLVATYVRIGRCLKYHPVDIKNYKLFLSKVLEYYNFN